MATAFFKNQLVYGKSALLKRDYQYDAAGQLTDLNDSRRGPLAYRYDLVGRLLEATSRLGVETFAFDPASNLLDEKTQQIQRPLEQNPKRNKLMDNLLRQYAGTHYEYDERGNQIQRLHNGQLSRLHWDLFDRLVRFENTHLSVEYAYDALGRRLYKNSNAHHRHNPEAGSQWNKNEQARKQRELGCDFTLFGWDGDTLAWESTPPQDDGGAGRTVHYIYEPGTFVPVAQAMRHSPIRLLAQPSYEGSYDIDEDPLWTYEIKANPIDVLAWYQCDHLGTPQELTDHNGQMAWSAQYKAWGEVREQRSEWAQREGLTNPIRFQGQYHDHETGLHYNRYRYYDPQGGRFISKDPISYAGGLNLYHYAPNPTGWIDPLGLWKGQPRNANGTFSAGANPVKACICMIDSTEKKHGNSIDSEIPATLYGRFDSDGNFEKWGISQDPSTRYSTTVLDGGQLKTYRSGPRSEILKQERRLVERFPGPLNKEPWAGSKKPRN